MNKSKVQIADNPIYSIQQMERLMIITVKADMPIEYFYHPGNFIEYFERDLIKISGPDVSARLFLFTRNSLSEQRFNEFFRSLKKNPEKKAQFIGSKDNIKRQLFSVFVNIQHRFVCDIIESDKLNMFAVEGPASGMWLSSILSGEFNMLSTDSQFTFPFIADQVVPLGGLMAYLESTMPKAALDELLLLREPLTAQQLLDMGLTNRIFANEAFADKAIDMAWKLSLQSSNYIASMKRFRYRHNNYVLKCMELEYKYYSR